MENVTDALIMAGSVLLLIIALTVGISSFSNLRVQLDEIVSSRDQVQMTQDSSGNYLNFIKSNDIDVRTVGIETVISSFRRMEKENYDIYIWLNKSPMPELKQELITRTNKAQMYKIQKNKKKSEIEIIPTGKDIIRLTMAGEGNKFINDETAKILYTSFKDTKFKEYIGIYQNKTSEGVSEANKQTFRIITFVEQ